MNLEVLFVGYCEELESYLDDSENELKSLENKSIDEINNKKPTFQALISSIKALYSIIEVEIDLMTSDKRSENQMKLTKYRQRFNILQEQIESLQLGDLDMLNIIPNTKSELITDKNLSIKTHYNTRRQSNNKVIPLHSNIQNKDSKLVEEYLLQSRRLLEETDRYGQQVLMNLNTQREQLQGSNNRLYKISQTLESSSQVLDKMTKWWYKLI
ncbi:hypothetical protein cand_010890 [Cryptosporidium andersoni]|uniref:Uncharacterized protein n=1 Tax=Cryptosporidium andersoni TaxID=117008 RepID=A0A1J4MSB5_9CRYT|nr:hypothetical protein cand_010890 [Cryptosporidium andersoni]